jgi:uncharacterized protein (TIGR00730 family)
MGNNPAFQTAARELGAGCARRGFRVVYGGASVGLMGVVADAALEGNGEVIGVIPHEMEERELAHRGLARLEIVESMHARKARMVELSDAFIALPGGLGTLDELFEIATWRQLGYHAKQIVIVNTGGFFDSLLAHLDHAEKEGFVPKSRVDQLLVAKSSDEALGLLLS